MGSRILLPADLAYGAAIGAGPAHVPLRFAGTHEAADPPIQEPVREESDNRFYFAPSRKSNYAILAAVCC